ncbi:MAG: RNHCP domain-containing protein [Defluviitaleaceae bacterium]|nr:RNHCP domain-containing protein [Defluviitaleaceae bacterium]
MSKKTENTGFTCANCAKIVLPLTNGSYRNHCPFCLYSLHVDRSIGDRANDCHGTMKPIGIIHHSKKGYQIIHVCQKCKAQQVNKVAINTVMPDDFNVILKLL